MSVDRPDPRPAAWHKLPIREKRALAIARQRSTPIVACARCGTRCLATEIAAHLARCAGSRQALAYAVIRARIVAGPSGST